MLAVDPGRLQELCSARRAAINPEMFGLPKSEGRGRRAKGGGLTQAHVDTLLERRGVPRAEGTYRKFEAGKLPNPSADYVYAVAKVLNFDEHAWRVLHVCLYGRAPARVLDIDSVRVSPVWIELVNRQHNIGYIANLAGEVLYGNRHFREMFVSKQYPNNLWWWMLFSDEARGEDAQGGTLQDWPISWAGPLISQIRSSLVLYPESKVLTEMHRRILEDPYTSPYWEFEAVAHPDGAVRPFRHPALGLGMLHLAASEPQGAPGSRHTSAIFVSSKLIETDISDTWVHQCIPQREPESGSR
ncbi:hypothetical protein SAZ11_07060 [Streptomyces sp. FXJ1.4098]|nr:hypothetical protein [Streptomyces sp. FXJ1.4098]